MSFFFFFCCISAYLRVCPIFQRWQPYRYGRLHQYLFRFRSIKSFLFYDFIIVLCNFVTNEDVDETLQPVTVIFFFSSLVAIVTVSCKSAALKLWSAVPSPMVCDVIRAARGVRNGRWHTCVIRYPNQARIKWRMGRVLGAHWVIT